LIARDAAVDAHIPIFSHYRRDADIVVTPIIAAYAD